MFSNPLETLPDKAKFARDFLNNWDTSCWRGYIAYWQLTDNKLYLTNIVSCSFANRHAVPLATLFGDQFNKGWVLADWFSGDLISPRGKLLRYYHDAYKSIYAYEMVYQFNQGTLSSKTVFDNRKTKISTYEVDNGKLKHFVYSRIAWNKLPTLPTDLVIKVFVRIISHPEGGKPAIKLIKGAGSVWDTEAVRVMRLLPEWSVDYISGKFRPTAYHFPILFSEANKKRYVK
ncbi:hypothetical protein [Spirosoma validum]|uniref:TonB C-terminal domain-containing protein n=1 Tax=Spirosoma validum TaxID=2771355 RepID=A0A927B2H5_9BACT|nr:hypothetical protein [Spirosoma validum]MBD2754113.1 hypothetical protein [Spirosoma validum]